MADDKKTQAQVEAELAAAKKRIAELEAGLPNVVDVKVKAKVAALKAAAKKEDGHALFAVGPAGHYREGRLYGEGEVVRIPLAEDPSHTFEPVKDGAAAKKGAAALAKKGKGAKEISEEDELEDETGLPPGPSIASDTAKKTERAADREI